ncbi:MAG: type II secretion system minor pseudopilin GspI [Betaproteobacteria bacterium]
MKASRGFTLVEVMVALTILAVAFAAGYRVLGQSTSNADLLKRRTLAQWVAQNQLAMMQLNPAGAASGNGIQKQAGIDFVWEVTLASTPNTAFRKVDIAVADKVQPDYRLARLSAYLSLSR